MKKIKSAVKKVTKSKLGKALLIGAAVFVGGAMLGAWNAPGALGAKINGALAKGAAGAAKGGATAHAATNTAAGMTSTALPAAAPSGAAIANSVIPAGVTPGATGAVMGAPSAGVMMPGGMGAAAEGAAATGAMKTGVISRMMEGAVSAAKGTASFANKHPFIAGAAVNGVASALSPDEIDLMREKQRIEQEDEDRRRRERDANLNIGDINLGMRPNTTPLQYQSTGQNIYKNGVLARLNRSV
jgi:hypothetical protein